MGEEQTKPEDAKKPMEEEKKEEKAVEPPPHPPQEIVLKVFMHCEGCAKKVRRSLKGFQGVEEVKTECRTGKVVVKGEKADPLKVLERVQRKSHRHVELISPIPTPPPQEPVNKPQQEIKTEEKTEEAPVITVVLGVYMHCEACAQEIKKRIQRMKGVEIAEADLKSSQVTVKGVFEPGKLADYVYKRTSKHAAIVKVEREKKDEEKGKDEKKTDDEKKEAKKDEEDAKVKGSGGSGGEPPARAEVEAVDPRLELKKNEFNYYYPQNYQLYPQRFVQEMNAYPPQMFSDENPNACTVM